MKRQLNKKRRDFERQGFLQKIVAVAALVLVSSGLWAQDVIDKEAGNIKEAESEIIRSGNFTDADFKLYPNPAADVVHIKTDVQLTEGVIISLSDITGSQLEKNIIGETPVSENYILNLKRYPAGQYIVNIRAVDGTFVAKKIIKRG